MYYVGVDPGNAGGICIMGPRKKVVVFPFQGDPYKDWRVIQKIPKDSKVCLERVHAVFGSRAKATFNFGKSVGRVEALLAARGLKYTEVDPKVWQSALSISPRKKNGRKYVETPEEWKWRLTRVSKKLYPRLECWSLSRTLQLKVGDAILIAEYCKHYETNKNS